jgi:hypothetical protein
LIWCRIPPIAAKKKATCVFTSSVSP